MPIPFEFDFKDPDYLYVYKRRCEKLYELRRNPACLPDIVGYYRDNIAQFIIDWGVTADPRNLERGLPVHIPFLLYAKQEEFVNWVIENWRNKQSCIVEKSRDMGITWLCVAIATSICLFNQGAVFGFGSRKEEYVDKLGDLDSILEKVRFFLANLPVEFRGGWSMKWSKDKLIQIPATSAIIKGESGDNLGRGGRTSGYFVDEAAHLARPELIEASLSATTNFRVDVSTPRGRGNPFAEKRHSGKFPVFTLRWQDDPRKDDAWYERMKLMLDPVTLAQEVDLDYSGSIEGILIPAEWVYAAIDAHVRLNVEMSGKKIAALDVADQGKDLNALCLRHGIVIERIDEWTGVNSDILFTADRAVKLMRDHGYTNFYYDAEGVGSGIKGDIRSLNEKHANLIPIKSMPFRSSSTVWNPNSKMILEQKNIDFFENKKAQAWWQLRLRFQNTFRAIKHNEKFNPGSIISIPGDLKNLSKVLIELSQPTYSCNGAGKVIIDKNPKNARSPNLADAIMIAFHEANDSIRVTPEMVKVF